MEGLNKEFEESVIFSHNDLIYNIDKFESNESNILLVTGLSGSGKSTLAAEMVSKYKAEWVELDLIEFALKGNLTENEIAQSEWLEVLLNSHKSIYEQKGKIKSGFEMFRVYQTLLHALLSQLSKDKHARYIVEGLQIYEIYSYEQKVPQYPLIIKGTSALTSALRAVKRNDGKYDLKAVYKMLKWLFEENKSLSDFEKMIKKEINMNVESYNESCKNVNEARKFVHDVSVLAKKYDANYFIVTDGASGIHNRGNQAVNHARKMHEEWERKHGEDPDEDWSKEFEEAVIFSHDDLSYGIDRFENGESNILLVTGLSGSGKSTLAAEMVSKYKAEWVELDLIEFALKGNFSDNEVVQSEWLQKLLKSHKEIHPQESSDYTKETFKNVRTLFYALMSQLQKDKKTKYIVEGIQIYEIYSYDKKVPPYPIIIKGTSALTSALRAVKRNDGKYSASAVYDMLTWLFKENKSLSDIERMLKKDSKLKKMKGGTAMSEPLNVNESGSVGAMMPITQPDQTLSKNPTMIDEAFDALRLTDDEPEEFDESVHDILSGTLEVFTRLNPINITADVIHGLSIKKITSYYKKDPSFLDPKRLTEKVYKAESFKSNVKNSKQNEEFKNIGEWFAKHNMIDSVHIFYDGNKEIFAYATSSDLSIMGRIASKSKHFMFTLLDRSLSKYEKYYLCYSCVKSRVSNGDVSRYVSELNAEMKAQNFKESVDPEEEFDEAVSEILWGVSFVALWAALAGAMIYECVKERLDSNLLNKITRYYSKTDPEFLNPNHMVQQYFSREFFSDRANPNASKKEFKKVERWFYDHPEFNTVFAYTYDKKIVFCYAVNRWEESTAGGTTYYTEFLYNLVDEDYIDYDEYYMAIACREAGVQTREVKKYLKQMKKLMKAEGFGESVDIDNMSSCGIDSVLESVMEKRDSSDVYFEAGEEDLFLEAANIDADIREIIDRLNEKGYKTKYSCSGHPSARLKSDGKKDGIKYGKLYSTARIIFEKDYDLPSIPKYWEKKILTDNDESKVSIYVKYPTFKIINGLPIDQFNDYKKKYMYHLEKWSKELPNEGDLKETEDGDVSVAESADVIEAIGSVITECLVDATF